jgi:hypothetical protein
MKLDRILIAKATLIFLLAAAAFPAAAGDQRPLLLHVKTALSVDDAQICVVPNIAWAAIADGRPVTMVFDGSAVTSIAKGLGWRGWVGISSTAMDRASLPERERVSIAEQLGVPLATVPHDYGEYLHLLKKKGVKIVYNRTMAVLFNIPVEKVDTAARPVGLKELLKIMRTEGDYLVY